MGGLLSCCCRSAESAELITPDMETRRQHQREAAEKRARENETRGIKNFERVQQQKIHDDEVSRRMAKAERMSSDSPTLRVRFASKLKHKLKNLKMLMRPFLAPQWQAN